MASKVCKGPTHDRPTALPLDARYWYYYASGERQGKPLAQCIACNLFRKTGKSKNVGRMINVGKIEVMSNALVKRKGSIPAAARYSGISETTLRSLCNRTHNRVQKQTVHKLVVALDRAQREER